MNRRDRTMKKTFLTRWFGFRSPLASARLRACESDPGGMLAELQEEQSRLAEELEDTFRAFDERVRSMAKRMAGVGGDPITKKEMKSLKNEQMDLWRLVRRAQASSRTTRELQRELKEWTSRPEGVAPFGHPDHPVTRAELVASELRVRGIGVGPAGPQDCRTAGLSEGSVYDAGPMEVVFDEGALADGDLGTGPDEEEGPEWEHEEEEALLKELRNRKREMERILESASPSAPIGASGDIDEGAVRELALFLGELRELHGHLRENDRRNGVTRERWQIGMPEM
jgi:hypothetical protein